MARVKVKDSEKLDPSNLRNVISLLESDKPITKKEACSILRISYNTTRLSNIIAGFKEREETTKRLRAKNYGIPASKQETVTAIERYLDGEPLYKIADSMFRSSAFIKGIMVRNNVPVRITNHSYFQPQLLPDEVLSEEFEPGELVWSTQYNHTAEISKIEATDNSTKCYGIWVLGDYYRHAFVPWYELGSLRHLQQLGVKINDESPILGQNGGGW
jgi:hypothetical protein|tara:strand:- start:6124 stop:6771 length:648 start_codon:yes stop_codon:yes gene_type:complete